MVLSPVEQTILVQILHISSSLLSKYSTVQDRLLWLIFIPHVLLVIFIWVFSESLAKMGGGTHTGIKTLVAIAAYITIIFSGWYGTYIVPIFISVWQLVLALALIMFVAARFMHPGRAKEMMTMGKVVKEKVEEKGKIRKQLEHQRDSLKRMIRDVDNTTVTSTEGRQMKEAQIIQLKTKLAEIESELNDL